LIDAELPGFASNARASPAKRCARCKVRIRAAFVGLLGARRQNSIASLRRSSGVTGVGISNRGSIRRAYRGSELDQLSERGSFGGSLWTSSGASLSTTSRIDMVADAIAEQYQALQLEGRTRAQEANR
jgi:hypothetical protein